MERKRLIQAVLVALAGLVLANLAVRWAWRNAAPRQVVTRLESPRQLKTLVIGNSVVAAGFDAAVFDQARPDLGPSENLGLGWTTPIQHAAILTAALRRHPETRTVIYPFFGHQLGTHTNDNWRALAGNFTVSYYVAPEVSARHYAPDSWIAPVFFTAASKLALFTDRYLFWAKTEKVRRTISSIGRPAAAENPEGGGFGQLMQSDDKAFTKDTVEWISRASLLSPPVRDIIRLAKEGKLRLVFVEMPLPSKLNRQYRTPEWAAYREKLAKELQGGGAELIGDSAGIEDSQFKDDLHLAPAGAVLFSKHLAELLR